MLLPLTLSQLAKASTLALISMLVIIVTVITQGPQMPAPPRGRLGGNILINDGVFQAIGVISFAFVCHHNSLLIYGSLRTRLLLVQSKRVRLHLAQSNRVRLLLVQSNRVRLLSGQSKEFVSSWSNLRSSSPLGPI